MDAALTPPLTYAPHGGSLELDPASVPEGFRVFRHEAVIGSGRERWASAAGALLRFVQLIYTRRYLRALASH